MRKIAKSISIILLLAGLFRAAWLGGEIAKLNREKAELQKVVGKFDSDVLSVDDFHVQRRPTTEPLHFEWSFSSRHPRWNLVKGLSKLLGHRCQYEPGFGGIVNPTSSPIHRQSLFFDFRDQHMVVHAEGFFQRTTRITPSPELIGLIRDRWDELDIEIFADDGLATLDSKTPTKLLTISVPEAWLADSDLKLSEIAPELIQNRCLFEFELVPFSSSK